MKKSILFVGQAFYNAWYLSRELRKLGWKADLINIDSNNNIAHSNQYHGQDLDLDYLEILYRKRFMVGKKNEIIFKNN